MIRTDERIEILLAVRKAVLAEQKPYEKMEEQTKWQKK